jgi:hypothetical protein
MEGMAIGQLFGRDRPRDHPCQVWFNLVEKSSPLKLLSQSQPNFAEMILGWSSSKIVSGISDL